ncbi:MAG: S16 family serine protease [Terracoccus sp.]
MRTIKWAPRGAPKGAAEPGNGGGDAVPAAPGEGASGHLTRGNKTVLGVFFGVLIVLVIGSLVHLPYAIESPGPTINTLGEQDENGKQTPLIVVSDLATYPTQGSLKFTTVRIQGGPGYPVDLWDVLGAWLDPARDVSPVADVFAPDVSKEQVAEENTLQMQGSQQEATAVALRAIGKKVPTYIVIAGLTPTSKGKDVLKANDRLESIDGTKVTGVDNVRSALAAVKPGDIVKLVVIRGGKQVPVSVPTITGQNGGAALGVLLGVEHDFPAKITINAGAVGGPSAGLMFSLGIYDKLTPGALTGDHQIAGTGTIDDQANVGPIGGIAQKMVGARNGGADYFLAPAANCSDVVGNIPEGLQVFKVGTFDQAKTVVEGIAKGQTSALPRCT